MLSLAVTAALASALGHQSHQRLAAETTPTLSEQLARRLGHHRLSLLGTEQPLAAPATQLILQLADRLSALSCNYCRLVYQAETVVVEAMLSAPSGQTLGEDMAQQFQTAIATARTLGGELQVQMSAAVAQVRLQLPLAPPPVVGSPLSEREQEVMELLAQGCRDRDIAEQLYISERTVKFHAKNILEKLQVRTRIQAVFKATKQGWLA